MAGMLAALKGRVLRPRSWRRLLHRAGLEHAHAARVGRAHAERADGDLLHARMQAPGARLELQLAVLDFEGPRPFLLALELGEELAGLVLRGDEPERADEENQE